MDWVNYAGLEDNDSYALHKKYCPKGAGSVFTFGLKGGYDAGVKLVNSVKLFSHLANIGDTRSLIIHPASTTHRQLSDEDRIKAGAGPDVGAPVRRHRGQCRHHRGPGTGAGVARSHSQPNAGQLTLPVALLYCFNRRLRLSGAIPCNARYRRGPQYLHMTLPHFALSLIVFLSVHPSCLGAAC